MTLRSMSELRDYNIESKLYNHNIELRLSNYYITITLQINNNII